MALPQSCDLFCRVVDNYGDIGVCWRLARQLAAEHGLRVRLWVDDLAAFRRINPEADAGLAAQTCREVEIRHWVEPFSDTQPAEMVVEAFGCALPECYVQAMAAHPSQHCWINLEYLSAENWIGECHGLASPSPRLPLTKHFFFPGFAADTGGVLRERDLDARRQAFQRDERAQTAFWQELGLPEPHGEECRVSLFCYPGSRAEELFTCWREQKSPVTCLVPEGIAGEAIAAFFGQDAPGVGDALHRGSLELRVLPFLEQDRYDHLLWACNCNFVRGEDSFVRAQWALRPMVWQPYPQAEGTHLRKLEAFLSRYCQGMPGDAAEAVSAFWVSWSRGAGMAEVWPAFWMQQMGLARHVETWAAGLRSNGDLATKLVQFCANKI